MLPGEASRRLRDEPSAMGFKTLATMGFLSVDALVTGSQEPSTSTEGRPPLNKEPSSPGSIKELVAYGRSELGLTGTDDNVIYHAIPKLKNPSGQLVQELETYLNVGKKPRS